jgi:hypothetical protein
VKDLPAAEALIRIGLETQYFCTADPSGWDPINGKSPVHFAGDLHKAALKKALESIPNHCGAGRTPCCSKAQNISATR